MHINVLDVYQKRESLIHRLDPRVKLIVMVSIILTTMLLPQDAWGSQGALFGLLILLSTVAKLGPFFTIRRAFIALPFMLTALPLPFLTPGDTLWVLPGVGWTVTASGLERFLVIIFRTWIAVQAGVFLSATTEIHDLLWGLKALRVPKLIVDIVGFMVRYLFILADEALRMIRARTSRSPVLVDVRRPGVVWQARTAGMMVGNLFLRSLDRSERVHAAMLSRGYDGEMRVLEQPKMVVPDWLFLFTAGCTLILLFWLGMGN